MLWEEGGCAESLPQLGSRGDPESSAEGVTPHPDTDSVSLSWRSTHCLEQSRARVACIRIYRMVGGPRGRRTVMCYKAPRHGSVCVLASVFSAVCSVDGHQTTCAGCRPSQTGPAQWGPPAEPPGSLYRGPMCPVLEEHLQQRLTPSHSNSRKRLLSASRRGWKGGVWVKGRPFRYSCPGD